MYNKIFTKILDSSIWLETHPTRIVWLTMIAAMDETGFCAFASPANLARRAVVTAEELAAALVVLEGPDANSSDPENEGRRLERVPGGWIVLNAEKYRLLVTRAVANEKARERMVKWRASKSPKAVTSPLRSVTQPLRSVTPSETEQNRTDSQHPNPSPAGPAEGDAERLYALYPRRQGRQAALKAIRAALRVKTAPQLSEAVKAFALAVSSWPAADQARFVPHPATWFNRGSYDDDRSTWARQPVNGRVDESNLPPDVLARRNAF